MEHGIKEKEKQGGPGRFAREFLADLLIGAGGGIGTASARQLGDVNLAPMSRQDLELFLKQPEQAAKTEELRARARQRLQVPGRETEEFKIFQQAVRNVFQDPLVKMGLSDPMERNQRINEEFEILQASRKGKVAKSLQEKGKSPTPSIPSGNIRVKIKATGQTGTINQKDFNLKTMEKL